MPLTGCSQGVVKGILLPKRAVVHRSQGLLNFSVRLNSMSLTSHIVRAKRSSTKLLLAGLVPSVWVICRLSQRACLGHRGCFPALHNIKRKGDLGSFLHKINKLSSFQNPAVLCVYISVCIDFKNVAKCFIKGIQRMKEVSFIFILSLSLWRNCFINSPALPFCVCTCCFSQHIWT